MGREETTVSEENASKFLWFMAGMTLGAAVAILYAPVSGEETRRAIGDNARKFGEKARDRSGVLTDSGKELIDRGRELYDKGREIVDEAADLFERGRKLVQG